MTPPFVFTGGVQVSWSCLEALCREGWIPSLAIGYPPSLSSKSGYRSLGELAARYGIPLIETENLNSAEVREAVADATPAAHLVVGWSRLIGRRLLSVPVRGSLGIHPTRLPEGRGRAPIPWTLIRGLRKSAVTLFYLTERADDGDIVDQIEFEVSDVDDAGTLYRKVEDLHVRILLKNIDGLLSGTAPRRPQDDSAATFWPARCPGDGWIDWAKGVDELYNWVRGLTHPYPGAFTTYAGRTLWVWRAVRGTFQAGAEPGLVTGVGEDGIRVASGEGQLWLLRVQFEGEAEQSAAEVFRRGLFREGDRLGI